MHSPLLYQWQGPSHLDGLVTLKAVEFSITNQQGRRYQARLVIQDDAQRGIKKTLPFEAVYKAEGRWEMTGQNVRVGNQVNPDRIFDHNQQVDHAMRLFVREKLNDFVFGHQNDHGQPRKIIPSADTPPLLAPTAEVTNPKPEQPPVVIVATPPVEPRLEAVKDLVGHVLLVETARIRPDPEQPRKWFDQEQIAELADSLVEMSQMDTITVVPVIGVPGIDYEIVDGERRWRAAKLALIRTVRVEVLAPFADPLDKHLSAVVLNLNRETHTVMEISNALQKQIDGGRTVQQLANAFGHTVTWVYEYLSYQRLIPKLQALLGPPTPEKEQLAKPIAKILLRYSPEIQSDVYESVILKEKNPRLRLVKVRIAVSQFSSLVPKRARELKPSDHGGNLLAFVARLTGDTTMMSHLPHVTFRWLVRHRSSEEIAATLAEIEEAGARLKQLAETIRMTQGFVTQA